MPYLVIKSASNATPESYQLTNTWEKPRLAVKTQKTSTSSYSYPVTTTVLTSSSNSEGMSNVSSYTDASTTNIVYETGTSSVSSYREFLTATTKTLFQGGVTRESLWTRTEAGEYYSSSLIGTYDFGAVNASILSAYRTSYSYSFEGKISPDYVITTNSSLRATYMGYNCNGRITVPIGTTSYNTQSTYSNSDKSWSQTLNGIMDTWNTLITNTVYETESGTYYSGVSSSTLSESASTTCYTDISSLYLPLSTDTSGAGLKVKDSGNTYRVMKYTTTSHSQSASATFLTSAVDSAGLSNTTALTRSSSSGTSALTEMATTGTFRQTMAFVTYESNSMQGPPLKTGSMSLHYDIRVTFTSISTSKSSVILFIGTEKGTQTRSFKNTDATISSTTISTFSGSVGASTITNYPLIKTYNYEYPYGLTSKISSTFGQPEVDYPVITTGTLTLTRSSISGYSGVSSSSSSELASTTSWG